MLLKIPSKNTFIKDYGWHTGRFHFSFGDYKDSANQAFGVLRAFNDFVVDPKCGFETHPHSEMEIISYCVNGDLTHQDNIGHINKLRRGDSQYTCCGSGITHSEMNENSSMPLRLIQIWIKPTQIGLKPTYSENRFFDTKDNGHLRCIASGDKADGAMQITQNAHVYVAEIEVNQMIQFEHKEGRQSYIVCLEGEFLANGFNMIENDAMKLWGKDNVNFIARKKSHLIIVEMAIE